MAGGLCQFLRSMKEPSSSFRELAQCGSEGPVFHSITEGSLGGKISSKVAVVKKDMKTPNSIKHHVINQPQHLSVHSGARTDAGRGSVQPYFCAQEMEFIAHQRASS